MVRENGELEPATWDQAIAAAAKKLSAADADAVAALASPRATTESLTQFAELFKGLGAGNVGSMTARSRLPGRGRRLDVRRWTRPTFTWSSAPTWTPTTRLPASPSGAA